MSDEKCPFCGEPMVRSMVTGYGFRCGTKGPDINGEYDTGHVCDISTFTRLIAEQDDEIERLTRFIEDRVADPLLYHNGGYHSRRIYLEARKLLHPDEPIKTPPKQRKW